MKLLTLNELAFRAIMLNKLILQILLRYIDKRKDQTIISHKRRNEKN